MLCSNKYFNIKLAFLSFVNLKKVNENTLVFCHRNVLSFVEVIPYNVFLMLYISFAGKNDGVTKAHFSKQLIFYPKQAKP